MQGIAFVFACLAFTSSARQPKTAKNISPTQALAMHLLAQHPTAASRAAGTAWHSVGMQPRFFSSRRTDAPQLVVRRLLNRFRKKKVIASAAQIVPGDELPEVDVEIMGKNKSSVAVSLPEVLGNGTALLVGMPGAYTPTCSTKHLPSLVKNFQKLQSLGVEKVAVITTNDRFVNKAWLQEVSKWNQNNSVVMLSDGDGDALKELGLIEDMGFGVGTRSKRFALVTQNLTAKYISIDEGMDACNATSIESIVAMLSPEGEMDEEQTAALALGTILLGTGVWIAKLKFGGLAVLGFR